MFIPMGNPIIGGALATAVYASSNSNNSSPINTITRNSQSIGTAHNKRRIILLLYNINANLVSDTTGPTSVTVDGVGLTRVAQRSGSSVQHSTVWASDNQDEGGPSGTSVTVSVARSIGNGFTSLTGWGIWACYNVRSSTPFDTLFTGANPTASGSIDTAGGGILLGLAAQDGPYSWGGTAGIAEDFDTTGGVGAASEYTGASRSKTPGASAATVSCTGSAFIEMLAASFR